MLIIKKQVKNYVILFALTITLITFFSVYWLSETRVALAERTILFPVLGGGKYTNDYLGARSGGPHHATDIFANKHTPLVAAVDGTITYVGYPQPSWGYMIQITDADGYEYNYLHINNDNPGTDDGRGDGMFAYASDMKQGNKVAKGQLIGYVGDSGNAEDTPPHLHFEIYRPNGTPVNPYEEIKSAPIRYVINNRSEYPQMANEALPYGPYEPGLNLAIGNFDADPQTEVVTGAGINGGPHVKIFEKNMAFTGKEFFAYDPRFRGGADVAAGDLDGDGIDEIITGAGRGGGPHVQAFKTDGTVVASFFAYDSRFSGGVYVGAGDIDGDGRDEIITGPGAGGGPNVKAFKYDGRQIASYFPYNPKFSGGVDVSAGDVAGDGRAEIVTAAGPGGGPHVRVMSYVGDTATPVQYLNDFFAYDSGSFFGGVRVSVGNVQTSSAKSEILTAPQSSGGPHIKMFNGSGARLSDKMFMESWWYGYNDIAAGENTSNVGTGTNRRASVRAAF